MGEFLLCLSPEIFDGLESIPYCRTHNVAIYVVKADRIDSLLEVIGLLCGCYHENMDAKREESSSIVVVHGLTYIYTTQDQMTCSLLGYPAS